MLQKLRQYTRGKRLGRFNEFMKGAIGPVRLIDLGGTVRFWENWGLKKRPLLDVTLANSHDVDISHSEDPINLPNLRRERVNVLTLSASDLARYDVIFSNSMIEHLPNPDAQRQLARAIVDSGRPYFLQTPNKRSPVDPHFPSPLVPFFAAYPRKVQARLLTWSPLGSPSAATSYAAAIRRLENYHPLSVGDIRRLFPQARVVVERPMGVPMSIIAMSEART